MFLPIDRISVLQLPAGCAVISWPKNQEMSAREQLKHGQELHSYKKQELHMQSSGTTLTQCIQTMASRLSYKL